MDGGGIEGSDWFRAQATLREELEWVVSRGLVLRDPDAGLVDFPSERDGREIYLCWRLGEGDVDPTPEQLRKTFAEEKWREDRLRGTGREMVRVVWAEADDAHLVQTRLDAAIARARRRLGA